MKTLCVMDSVSRANGGMFEAERKLQQHLHLGEGIDVQVIAFRDSHSAQDRDAWLPLVPVTLPVFGPRAFGYAPAFVDFMIKAQADLAYVAGLWKFNSLATLRWARRTGRPVIIAPHGMLDPWALRNSRGRKKIAARLFQNALLREASCLRALCQAEAKAMRAYGLTNPICVIPNGVDLPTIDQTFIPRPHFFPPKKKILLYLGRFHPKKGLENLVSAWKAAGLHTAGWVLALAGWDQDGHEAELKKQATALGLMWSDSTTGLTSQSSLSFTGPQFETGKAACYQHCDAFILPSFSEGLPMAVLEAWAFAKPVVMTAHCHLPEGFSSNAAIPIEATALGITEGLSTLFAMSDDTRQRMGRQGFGLVAERFTWPQVAADLHLVYQWVLGKHPRPPCVQLP